MGAATPNIDRIGREGLRLNSFYAQPSCTAGRISGEIVDMTDLLPTLAAAAGEPGVVEKLAKGASYGSRSYKVHLDGFDETALLTGKSPESARKFIFYYDETVLTAIRFKQFPVRQVGLSAQMGKTIEGIQSQILKIKQTQ
jgi:arylsulfatase